MKHQIRTNIYIYHVDTFDLKIELKLKMEKIAKLFMCTDNHSNIHMINIYNSMDIYLCLHEKE